MIEFKFSDFFYPLDLARTYLLLHSSEHWTPEQIARYQAGALAKLLLFCGSEVPYYQTALREAGISVETIRPDNAFEVLRRLPILDKDTLPRHAGPFPGPECAALPPEARLDLWDHRHAFDSLLGPRVKRDGVLFDPAVVALAGFRIGQPFLDVRSRLLPEDPRYLVGENGIRFIRNPKIGQIDFSSDLIDDGNIRNYYEVLLRFEPRLVRGHPQAIEYLVELLRKHGLNGWHPAVVTTASETLYDFQRRAIQEAWKVPILDSYGLIEHNVFIAQCRKGGYHVYPEYGVCEILDDEGHPTAPGEEGWIIATGLHNYAQPLLRYNTRDRAVAGDGNPCLCGRTLPTVERIVGRIDDCVVASNGKRYSGFSFAFFDRPGLKMARLVQEDLYRVTIEVVADPEFDGPARSALLQDLERKVEGCIKFEIRPVDRIEQELPGKFKFVVSRLSLRQPNGGRDSEAGSTAGVPVEQ